jgi:hypothetical protein
MPRNEYRIPRKDDLFHIYIQVTAKALMDGSPVPTWQRLGLTPDEKQQWISIAGLWVARYNDCKSPLTRTPLAIEKKNTVKKQFIAAATPMLARIAGSPNITLADRGIFRLLLPDRTLTARGKITEAPVASIVPITGAWLKIKTMRFTDSNRASLHKLADAIEMRYVIGGTQPATPDDCPLQHISTRATFILRLEAEHAGKRIYCFFRWVNFSRPQNNGGWSGLYQCVVA